MGERREERERRQRDREQRTERQRDRKTEKLRSPGWPSKHLNPLSHLVGPKQKQFLARLGRLRERPPSWISHRKTPC